MARDTIAAKGIVPSGGGTLALGSSPGSTMTPSGGFAMGAAQGIAISDGGVTGSSGSFANVPGHVSRINLTARGTQLANYGTTVCRRINILYTTFSVAATTAFVDFTIDDFVPTANDDPWICIAVYGRQIANFGGGAVTAVDLTCGDSNDADGYIKTGQVDLFSGAPNVFGDIETDLGVYLATHGLTVVQPDKSVAKFRVTLTATGDNLDQMTAGEVSIYALYRTIPND